MNGTLMFASEIKAFMEHPKFDKVFNEAGTWQTIFLSSLCLRMRHFSKGCSVYSRDIILHMKMEKWRLHVTLNRISRGDCKKSFEEDGG